MPLSFANAATIERTAETISDPIERLRFLRSAATAPVLAPARRQWSFYVLLSLLPLAVAMRSDAHLRRTAAVHKTPDAFRVAETAPPDVWLIEETHDYEVYSNGLRVENQLAVANHPRNYQLITKEGNTPTGILRSLPAGIVYHTTEGEVAPFDRENQHDLTRIGRELLLYVRNKRAYHFVIDRFGRVHRIVFESDTANHAGRSIWADSQYTYLELNSSFLGIAFEAHTSADQPPVSDAQIYAAKALTEMLRSKYNIPAGNCVTHAQVSVNPDNMRIGWHRDWSKGLPFEALGLPVNYLQPLASLYLFGFESDQTYVNGAGMSLRMGLAASEDRLRQAAAANHMPVQQYRAMLRRRYRDYMTALQHGGADEEN